MFVTGQDTQGQVIPVNNWGSRGIQADLGRGGGGGGGGGIFGGNNPLSVRILPVSDL